MTAIRLSNGLLMPQIGLGTWLSTGESVKKAVKFALDEGYRHIDTATFYGNEKEIGEALTDYFASGKLAREDVFITTKCWTNNLGPGAVEPALRESLRRLQLAHVDNYLVHMPGASTPDGSAHDPSVTVEDIWKEFEGVHVKGLTRCIGVSNFSCEQVERVLKIAKTPIHTLQVENHLYLHQEALSDLCKKHDIVFTAFAPLGSPGRLECKGVNGTELNWPPAPNQLEDPLVKSLADKYGKSPAQILLRHLVEWGHVVVPKSVNPSHIRENFQIFDFKLEAEDLEALKNVKVRHRLFLLDYLIGHPEDPLKDER